MSLTHLSRVSQELPPGSVDGHSAEVLKRWLQTREASGMALIADKGKPGLVKLVTDMLQVEKEKIARGEFVRICDPEGVSLHQHLVRSGRCEVRDLPQLNPDFKPPVGEESWTWDREEIEREAPVLEAGVMLAFLKRWGVPGEFSKTFKKGYTLVKRLIDVNLKFCPPQPDRPGLCWFLFSCPASMKPEPYSVCAAVKFFAATPAEVGVPARPAFVEEVVAVRCMGCHASASTEYAACIHCSAILHVIHNLKREEGPAAETEPSTSRLCTWNQPRDPTSGEMFNLEKPVAYLSFPKDDVHHDRAHGEEKRDTAARSDQAPRLSFNPIPPGDEATRNRNAPARLAALKKLHDTLAADLAVKGEPMKCASEVQWGHERRGV